MTRASALVCSNGIAATRCSDFDLCVDHLVDAFRPLCPLTGMRSCRLLKQPAKHLDRPPSNIWTHLAALLINWREIWSFTTRSFEYRRPVEVQKSLGQAGGRRTHDNHSASDAHCRAAKYDAAEHCAFASRTTLYWVKQSLSIHL